MDIEKYIEINPKIMMGKPVIKGTRIYRLKKVHHRVILIRLQGYSPDRKAEAIKALLLKHQTELPKSFTVIQPNAIRIRR